MALYASVAELKVKNSSIELTHSDDDIEDLLDAASRIIDEKTKRDDDYFADTDYYVTVPNGIKMATIYVANYLYLILPNAGITAKGLAGVSMTLEKNIDFEYRLHIMTKKYKNFYKGFTD